MIHYTTATTEDLKTILVLQKANLASGLTSQEKHDQGFVTVEHTYDQLKKLNDFEKHIIARDNNKVIGYLLAMTQHAMFDIPVLVPMFNLFETVVYENKVIAEYNYIVVGQVCIDKAYRGKGILDNCYATYKKFYSNKYDFAITEIASTNRRSLNAHKRIGFKELYTYSTSDNIEWIVVNWNWKNKN